jgi:hypothetical protein
MKVKTDNNGIRVYLSHRNEVTGRGLCVKESQGFNTSSDRPHVYIFQRGRYTAPAALHLDVEEVRLLVKGLKAWLKNIE